MGPADEFLMHVHWDIPSEGGHGCISDMDVVQLLKCFRYLKYGFKINEI